MHIAIAGNIGAGKTTLTKLLAKKYKLIIITNGLTKVQNVRIRQSTIAKYFDKIIIFASSLIILDKFNKFDVGFD